MKKRQPKVQKIPLRQIYSLFDSDHENIILHIGKQRFALTPDGAEFVALQLLRTAAWYEGFDKGWDHGRDFGEKNPKATTAAVKTARVLKIVRDKAAPPPAIS